MREARRIALAAQGMSDPRPVAAATRRSIGAAIERLGLLQIDSVNVLTRMHYLPLYSRLGDYPRALLEEAAWGRRSRRTLFEYWAHEASLLPLETHPLLRWRMERAERGIGTWGRLAAYAGERRPEADALLARIAADGALAASDVGDATASGGWWGWSDAKSALEWLFWCGRVTTKERRGSFERVYDLPERVLPPAILAAPTPAPADAQRALLAIAARALGVATAGDLRDYFRLAPGDAHPGIAALVESGDLIPVEVDGWKQRAYVHRSARVPRKARAQALLAPFDPLIWERSRTERIFGIRYRIEIYTPAHKREHGYFVLPFLLGDAIVARVDLKSDRKAGALRVQAAHLENGIMADVAAPLATELRLMATWLGFDDVVVERRGALAARLAAALRG